MSNAVSSDYHQWLNANGEGLRDRDTSNKKLSFTHHWQFGFGLEPVHIQFRLITYTHMWMYDQFYITVLFVCLFVLNTFAWISLQRLTNQFSFFPLAVLINIDRWPKTKHDTFSAWVRLLLPVDQQKYSAIRALFNRLNTVVHLFISM